MESCYVDAFSGKNKAGFVDGSIKKPKHSSTAWKCNNDIIASWIINSVTKEIAASIVYDGSTKEVWDELLERFKQSNGPKIYQLRKELVTTRQGTMTIGSYYTKLKTIWQDLSDFHPVNECSCGVLKPFLEHLHSEYVMTFVMELNDSYATIRAHILLMDPLPSIAKVFSLIVQEEHQRVAGASTTSIVPVVFAVIAKSVFTKPVRSFSSLNVNQYNQLLEMLQFHLQKANTDSIAVSSAVSHATGASPVEKSTTYVGPSLRRSALPHQRPGYLQDYHFFEPSFYHQAIKYPHWKVDMDEEIAAMERIKTWSIVPLQNGHHAIGCKWVYRVKYKADETVERYKAHLVAKGYSQ